MSVGETGSRSSWFQRFLLPGLALKAVIIGGGYATGRELAEYFVPSGPWGGLSAMLLATLIWSTVAAVTFALARKMGAYDYRAFFQRLLGPGWVAFELAYLIFVILILAVFGAAAGAIGAATFGCHGGRPNSRPRSRDATSLRKSPTLSRSSITVPSLTRVP